MGSNVDDLTKHDNKIAGKSRLTCNDFVRVGVCVCVWSYLRHFVRVSRSTEFLER